jgi:signal peptidase II
MIRWFLLCTLPLWVADQVTKALVTHHFQDLNSRIEVIPGFFNLVRVHNTGMAFGVGNGSASSNVVFLAVAAAAIGLIGYLWRRKAFEGALSKAAVAFLVAGILGNVTDRLVRGYVVDFLDFNLGFMVWPSFNVADSCICLAAALLLLGSFGVGTAEKT